MSRRVPDPPTPPLLPAVRLPADVVPEPAPMSGVQRVAEGPPPAPVVFVTAGPPLFVRALWFVLVGWWLGGVVSALAWLCLITILGIPVGLWVLNRLPAVVTLKSLHQQWVNTDGVYQQEDPPQLPTLHRAVYFIAFGWWFSALWLVAAMLAVWTIIGLPLAFWMYNRVGAVTTLYRA